MQLVPCMQSTMAMVATCGGLEAVSIIQHLQSPPPLVTSLHPMSASALQTTATSPDITSGTMLTTLAVLYSAVAYPFKPDASLEDVRTTVTHVETLAGTCGKKQLLLAVRPNQAWTGGPSLELSGRMPLAAGRKKSYSRRGLWGFWSVSSLWSLSALC